MADVVCHEYPKYRERYFEIRRAGLPVIYLIPKKRATFYASLNVGIGSHDRFYRDGERLCRVERGCAHFLEHKLFACKDGGDAMEKMRDLGADVNAYTTGTSTCYLFNCRDRFAEALRELLSFVSEPYFTKENVEAEKKIILQEAAMYRDSPASRLFMGYIRQLYGKHPVRDEIVGTPASICRITPTHLLNVYRAYYHAGNMQLFIAGDLTPDDVTTALADVSLPVCDGFSRIPPDPDPPNPRQTVCVRYGRVNKPLFAVSLGLPEPEGDPIERHRRMLAVSVVNAYLFSDSGSLYGELRQEKLLTAPMNCSAEWTPGICFLAVTGESARPRKVFERIRERVRRFLDEGIPEDDLLRLCRADYASDVAGFDDAEGLTDAFSALMPEGIDPYRSASLFGTLSAEYVNDHLRRILSPDRLHLCVIRPNRHSIPETEDIE